MPMVGSSMSAALNAALTGKGMVGSELTKFCTVVGNGCVTAVVGKAFVTTDAGTTPNAGTGTGVGISGVVKAVIVAEMQVQALAEGYEQVTPEFTDVADAIATALISELAKASLSSTHAPVYLGVGTINPGSITVSASTWASAMEAAGVGQGLIGSRWPNFCRVVAKGCVKGMLSGTGTVTIIGTPPGSPVPGVGVGSGTIS